VREDVEHDWQVHDVLLVSSDLVGEYVDLVSHFLEVEKLLVRDFFEDGPGSGLRVQMVQPQLQWSSGHNALKDQLIPLIILTSPLGKKSSPTMDSNTLDFPEL
jgi:hypothetical protein